MLAQQEVVPYLLQHDLLHPIQVVEDSLTVLKVTSRNISYKVLSETAECYLLKQSISTSQRELVANEAAAYKLFSSNGKTRLQRYVAGLHHYQPGDGILVVQSWPNAQNLLEYQLRRGRFSTGISIALGDALGTLHQCYWGDSALMNADSSFLRSPIWTLLLHRPNLGIYHLSSSADLKLIRIVQHVSDFREVLDDVYNGWRSETLIHGEVKWTNCIVDTRTRGRGKALKLIDWETACLGDPCWDVGCALSEYLSFWLLSIPITGEDPPEQFVDLARFPLTKMQPAIRAFWQAYVRRMGLDPETAQEWLLRSVRYAGARLVQTAYEYGQVEQQLNGNLICMLQLSFNILQRPQEAALHLLGIPVWQSMRL